MRFGTFHLFPWHERKEPAQVYRESLEQIRLSEEMGYDSAWLAEHHFSRYGIGSAIVNLAGMAAMVTNRIRIGTCVIVLPFYHPITLAEEVATVDVVSGGRFEFGIGRGYQWSEFHQLNIPQDEARQRYDESLDIILKAWTEDAFDYHGQFYTFNDIKVLPKPTQKPHPPVTVAVLSPDGIRKAAECDFAVFMGGSTSSVKQFERNLELYKQTLAEAGHPYQPRKIRVSRPVFVADSVAAARRELDDNVQWFLKTQQKVVTPPGGNWDLLPAQYKHYAENFPKIGALTPDFYAEHIGIWGPPEVVAEQIAEFDTIIGGAEDFICNFTYGGFDHLKTLKSMERFARDVMPLFKQTPVGV